MHGSLLISLVSTAVAAATLVAGDQAQGQSEALDLTTAISDKKAAEVHSAVDHGLRWLATRQKADGSFGSGERGDSLTSGFAIMAFMSRGHQPGPGHYGGVMSEGIDYLLSLQREDGSFDVFRYQGVIGTALSEVYGVTTGEQAAQTGKAVDLALRHSRRTQRRAGLTLEDRGGWSAEPELRSRLDATVWQLMFLRSAASAGFEVSRQSVDAGLAYVETLYITDQQQRARMTGVFQGKLPTDAGKGFGKNGMGMLSFQLHGRRNDPMVRAAADWLTDHPIPGQELGVYYRQCYACAQAMAQMGGTHWKSFFPRIVKRFLEEQSVDGAWRLRVPPRNRTGESGLGPAYNTALAVLTLTLPDQLLPIHQR